MFNVRVDYESTPVRHIAVQCPECKNWFGGRQITIDNLSYDYEIYYAEFNCPVCGKCFGGLEHADKPNIKEVGYPDIYKECLEKKEIWSKRQDE